jgi:two-component system sensor histidine kinase RegB
MPWSNHDDFGRQARQLRVGTLNGLRWMAVVGQSTAVIVTRFGLGLDLPLALCLACVASSAVLNIWLRWRFPVSQRLNDRWATIILGFDIVQLIALLYLTGGLDNPFSILLLAPVMISAASLPPARIVALLILALAATTALGWFYRPLPWLNGGSLQLPQLYSFGSWAALATGLIFVTIYSHRVAEEARQLARALTATDLVLAREQHLTQLDGLAAAAAHELGTPLATIATAITEMNRLGPPSGAFADDLKLVAGEIDRCRTILGKLTSLDEAGLGPLGELGLSQLIEEIVAPHRNFGVGLETRISGAAPEPVCRRNPGMIYGLGNLLDNALDFARDRVVVSASWTAANVRITISDDGPGFAANVLPRAGEPYVTTRGRTSADDAGAGGFGLGLFIAKTLLERSGGAIAFENVPPPESGARALIVWPRQVFEADRRTAPVPQQKRFSSLRETSDAPLREV